MDLSEYYFVIPIVIALLIIQAAWIFVDAKKKGENHWLWGLFGLINVPMSLIIYLIVTRNKRTKCGICGEVISKGYKCCPYCGGQLQRLCPQCNSVVKDDWKYCPACSSELK
ncbi:MAG: zinc ribbon domain-containing protein [Mahellales bacterium]|jgi:RNA polymerase subunit RPABC4/transcription elongation factor Spt4